MVNETLAILVMDDGETWGGIDGASICLITTDQYNDLIDGNEDVASITPIFEMALRDYTAAKRDDENTGYAIQDRGDHPR
tara:strand:- start:19 stop:258 length:240 start_codon:yes stop_codon:yes gene_type:complete